MTPWKRIYYNDNELVLTTNAEAYIARYPLAEHYPVFFGAVPASFSKAASVLERPGRSGAIIEDASQEALISQAEAMYRIVVAAGGVIINEKDELLMIFRRGKWDLPKGKLDEGEDIADCAVREVKEETGLSDVKLKGKIGDTYHVYSEKNEQVLKRTTWYAMTGSSADEVAPQQEEQIDEVRWVGPNEVAALAAASYAAIREVLVKAGRLKE